MATHSYQSKLYYGTNSNSYTVFPGNCVVELTFPDIAATAAASDGLTDLIKTTIPGKVDLGDLNVKCRFDETAFESVSNAFWRTNYYWRVQYPDSTPITNGSRVDFQGYVRTYTPPAAEDDATVDFDFNIKINTMPTFTAGT